MPQGRAALAALAVFLLAWPASRPQAAPTSASIVVDGDDSDWELVLVNPENTARDGDGSSLACLDSSDLDCPITFPAEDLAHFAWTFDGDSLSFRIGRHGGGNQALLLYVDRDLDGLMEDAEPVLVVPLASGVVPTGVQARLYLADAPGGDPMTSPAGLSDGHALPGTLQVGSTEVGTCSALDPAGRLHEASVSRDQLGLGEAPALGYHVSTATNDDPPRPLDNMAGAGGGAGSTAFVELDLDGGFSAGAAPGNFAELRHVIRNDGNVAALVRLETVAERPLLVETWADLDGDGDTETWLGTDVEGDGDHGGPLDVLAPEGDADADGRLDVGELAAGESRGLLLRVQLPPDSAGLEASLMSRAMLVDDETVQAAAEDVVLSGVVTISAPTDALGTPNHPAWLAHVVSRHSGSGAIDLHAKTDEDWPVELFEDVFGSGEPEDAVPPVDSDASGLPDLQLAAGESRLVWIRVDVPDGAALGMRESSLLRGLEDGIPTSEARARITVAPPVQLVPDHRSEEGNALRGRPSEGIWFAHRLINALGGTDPITLTAMSDLGWQVTLHEDPDGDGRPHDAMPLALPALVEVPRNGGELSLLLRVEVPASPGAEDSSRVTLSATPTGVAGRAANATDDAIASIVRTYEDETHVVAVSRVAACTPVHAEASGLTPSVSDYRFTWRAPDGTALRVQAATTDALGNCADVWTPDPGESGDGYSVDIQEFDGGAWSTLDTATLGIDDLGEAADPELSGTPYHLSGQELVARVEIGNGSELLPVEDLELRWIVSDADDLQILDGSGDFRPAGAIDWTRQDFYSLAPGETRTAELRVSAVSYPGTGEYRVLVELGSRCGDTAPFSATSFAVIDDADGDGLSLQDELAAGTDPNDADSDDDGLTDEADGVFDSDGDGLIDALDCDSDGDGLHDGLEAGAWQAGADTDQAAGCFVADLWPVSTTDPDQADTDGGGVSDGEEDANGNGRVDASETDPNDPADDPACDPMPAPELGDLRLEISGGSIVLTWGEAPLDACSSYRLLTGDRADALVPNGPNVAAARAEWTLDAAPAYWLVAVESTLAGLGDTGH